MSKDQWSFSPGQGSAARSGERSLPLPAGAMRRGLGLSAIRATMFVLGVLAVLLLAPPTIYQVVYADRIYLGVQSLGVDVGGYSAAEAKAALSAQFAKYAQADMVLRYGDKEWRATPGALGIRFDVEGTVRKALAIGRGSNIVQSVGDQIAVLRGGATVPPVLSFDLERQSAVMANLSREIDRPMINASLVVRPDGVVELTASQIGRKLDPQETARRLERTLAALSTASIELPVTETAPRVIEAQLIAAKDTAERILRSPITITYGSETTVLDRGKLTSMLRFRQEGEKTIAELDAKEITAVVSKMAEKIDRAPRDARFALKGGKVQLVSESVDGLTVDVAASVQAIIQQALTEQRTVQLAVVVKQPKWLSSDIAKIQLPDTLIEAATVYGDTGADRQHNLRLAVSRLDGHIIPPGERFSFNKALGPTTLADGYKMAWGIVSTGSGHDTVQSEAGGICQVSTTLFHAALWAGLQIDQRTEHLYWIARYGQPPLGRTGLDSTVDGSGSEDTLDFKFTNNTPNWLAIRGWVDGQKMYFALLGVKPNWQVEVSEPVITNVVKTDPTQRRVFDPELKPGQTVWVETPQDGFDSEVTRTVWEDGRVISRYVVKSHYRPAYNIVKYGPEPPPTPTATSVPAGVGTPGPTPATQPTPTATPKR